MTLDEIKEIVRRAIDECVVWTADGYNVRYGGHATCAFCCREAIHSIDVQHTDNCLVRDLKRIEDLESIDEILDRKDD